MLKASLKQENNYSLFFKCTLNAHISVWAFKVQHTDKQRYIRDAELLSREAHSILP